MDLQRFGSIAVGAVGFNLLKIAMVASLWYYDLGVRELATGLVALVALHGVFLSVIAVFSMRRMNGQPAPGSSDPQGAGTATLHPEREEGSIFRSIFRYCLPLLGARAAYLTGSNLSKVVLGKFLDLAPLGYFGFATTVVERFVGFVYALPSSLLPSMTELLAKRDRLRFTRLLDKSFRLIATAAAALSFGLFVYAKEITLLLGGEQYLAAVPVLQVMAIVPWVRTAHQPLTMAFYALKHTSWVLIFAVLKLSVEIAAYFVFIPSFGVQGAAAAHVLGALLAFIGALIWIGRNFQPSRHRWIVMGKTTALFFLTALATLALESSGTAFWPALGIKVFLFTPVFLITVFLVDLVTEDDLQRAGSVDIGHRRGRRARDAAVRAGIRLSRSVDSWRPTSFRTAEGN